MTTGPPPPQRVPADPAAARVSVAEVTRLLEATVARASTLSEADRNQRVNDDWSTVESIRHVVFVIDVWVGKLIKGEDDPFHPIGLPPHFVPAKPPGSSVDPDARPTFDEARDVLRGRLASLGAFVTSLDQADLDRPNDTHAKTVAGALGVVFDELTYHDGFINRDLDVIEKARA
jgi:hypothetical protein